MSRQAPNFALFDQEGTLKQLGDYAGGWLVLYFYPKDATPGCTTEACNFRDARDSIAALGNATVVGVSKDSVRKHANFAKKYDLQFTLLSDPSANTIKAYKSWGRKKFMGREFEGILRNSFIIDPSGKIVREYFGVNPKEHATEIITDLRLLQQQA